VIFFADENISSKIVRLLEAFDRDNEIKAHTGHLLKGPPTPFGSQRLQPGRLNTSFSAATDEFWQILPNSQRSGNPD